MNKSPPQRKRRITVEIQEAIYERIVEVAKREEMSVSGIIRRCLKYAIENLYLESETETKESEKKDAT